MTAQQSDVSWLVSGEVIAITELAGVCALSTSELDELVEYGALVPLQPAPQARVFSAECVVPLRTACKLRVDFDLDLFTVAIILGYLQRIDGLERQLLSVSARSPVHGHGTSL